MPGSSVGRAGRRRRDVGLEAGVLRGLLGDLGLRLGRRLRLGLGLRGRDLGLGAPTGSGAAGSAGGASAGGGTSASVGGGGAGAPNVTKPLSATGSSLGASGRGRRRAPRARPTRREPRQGRAAPRAPGVSSIGPAGRSCGGGVYGVDAAEPSVSAAGWPQAKLWNSSTRSAPAVVPSNGAGVSGFGVSVVPATVRQPRLAAPARAEQADDDLLEVVPRLASPTACAASGP